LTLNWLYISESNYPRMLLSNSRIYILFSLDHVCIC
jgi:hypothetical protein